MSLRTASSATDVAARAPCRRERGRLRRKLIEHPEIVTRIEQTAGHSLSHAAEADESDFHDRPYVEAALEGGTLTRARAPCKAPSPCQRGAIGVN